MVIHETICAELSENDRMDLFEVALLATAPVITCEVKHTFTPGLYSRMIFMPEGVRLTSKIHLQNHQYAILTGSVTVRNTLTGESELYEAPYVGITESGTRRALDVHEFCCWITYHPTNVYPKSESEEDIQAAVEEIERQIIQPHENLALKCVKENLINE